MDEAFESPRILIDGAKADLADIAAECAAWGAACRYEIVSHIDPQTGQKIVKARFLHRVPPTLRRKVTHSLTDLRHALDQATVEAAVMLGRSDGKHVAFPFKLEASTFRAYALKGALKGVHPELADFLLAFKAHEGGDAVLCRLCELANPAKHQKILQPSPNVSGVMLSGAFLGGGGETVIGTNSWNDLNNEVVLVKLSPFHQGGFDARFPMELILERPPSPLAGELTDVFRTLTAKVEHIVTAIEAETQRLLA